jgi:hypothetical protein
MGIKIIASRSPWMAYYPATRRESLPVVSKDIHTWFILKISKTPTTVFPYSKQLAPVAMVTSQPLCHFLYSKLHAVVAIVTLAKDSM